MLGHPPAIPKVGKMEEEELSIPMADKMEELSIPRVDKMEELWRI